MSANGRLTDAELTAVQGGRLSNTAAAAWNAMVAAAAKDGVSLVIASAETGNGAYRDFFTQGDMKVRPWLYGLSVYSTVNVAAAGHSTHGMGNAVDIGSFPPASNTRLYGDAGATRRDWVLKNAHRFGFTRTFGEADPNHFGHDGSRTTVASFEATPIPLPPKLYIPQGEEDMTAPIYAKGDKDDTVYALYVNAGDANSANGFAGAVYSGRRKVSRGEFLIVEQLGFPHEKQTKGVIKIAQAEFDKINKLAGSE